MINQISYNPDVPPEILTYNDNDNSSTYSCYTSTEIHNLAYNENEKIFYLSKELLCLQDGNFESDLWGGKIKREKKKIL